MKTSKSQLKMGYGICPKKIESRNETIIKTYRYYFQDSIPQDKQYWTICGKCQPNTLSEPIQIINSGLIKQNQFIGIEISKEIYEFNKINNPDLNFINNDFYYALMEHNQNKILNPAIINADMLLMPEKAANYLSKIIYLLSNTNNVMVVGNFITKTRHFHKSNEDMILELQKNAIFQNSMNLSKWNMHPKIYNYDGTGNTKTKMATLIFFKKE